MSERRPWVRPFELDPNAAEFEPEAAPPEPPAGPQQQPRRRWTPAAPARTAAVPLPKRQGRRLWGRLAQIGIVAALLAISLETVDRLGQRIVDDPLTGWPMAILLFMVGASTAVLLGREFLQLHRLHRRSGLRVEGARLAELDLHGPAQLLLVGIAGGLPQDRTLVEGLAAYDRDVDDTSADGERVRVFERHVLVPVDNRAYRLVLESARDIGLLTAISPYGLLDGLLVVWRTTLMLRSVARLYGIAPTPVSTLALLRRCLRNAALAGIADVATHAVLEHAGASIAAMLSARAGQGAGNALLAAKLGVEAIKEVRPLPFVEADPPSLRQIRKALLNGDRGIAKALREEA